MFGIPAWVWVSVALACFVAGLRLVLKAAHKPVFEDAHVLGFILSMAPLCVFILGWIFAKYHGP
jgi:hypothetical protein